MPNTLSTDFRELLDTEILPRVEKPSRYFGTELNTVHKDLSKVDLRFCLAFPDSYDIGLGNLGLQILYHILNRDPGTWAERVYAPGIDMENHLRRRGIPLFSLESRSPLADFDAIGFTLQWELTYTNIMNMLDMSGIPVLAEERDDRHPILLAGGPCVFNPEPLAMFIDAFVIGDGEDVVMEIAEALREGKGKSRDWQLDRLAGIGGVYVPSRYPMRQLDNGTLVMPEDAEPIVKRTVASLDDASFPTASIVPYTKQIHDRVSLEVLRGCTQGCRFCQAGMVTRPVRERELPNLDRLMEETIRKTGYEEVSLVSLSTCDYSKVKSLIHQSVKRAIPDGVNVGLPSLRLDSFSVEMADMISVTGKSSLTFAPEAATNRMRSVVNKFIPDEELLEMSRQAYHRGWRHIKLYFMIGLPTERDEDVLAIADLSNRVVAEGRKIRGDARVNLGVSTFCAKPHTPFQWERQISMEETIEKQEMLGKELRSGVKFGRHDPEESFIEGLLSRGDRRTGRLLYEAHRLGCRFDGWREHLNMEKWNEAIKRSGIDPDSQLRSRKLKEPLPWDHIDILVPKSWQEADYWRSRGLNWAADCRQKKCHQCGVIEQEQELCTTMLRKSHKGAKEEENSQLEKLEVPTEPPSAAKLRFKFARRGAVRLLSHLETMNMFLRAIRRAQLPVSYSQGFHPSPKMAFSCALPVGVETEGDYLDLFMREPVEPWDAKERLDVVLPDGFRILDAQEIPLKAPSLMSSVAGERYRVELRLEDSDALETIVEAANGLIFRKALWIEKKTKKGRLRTIDILPTVEHIEAKLEGNDRVCIEMLLVRKDELRSSAKQILNAVAPAVEFVSWRILKLASYIESEGELLDPLAPSSSEAVTVI